MVNFVAHVCFWTVFAVGSATTVFGLGMLGFTAYKKIRDAFKK